MSKPLAFAVALTSILALAHCGSPVRGDDDDDDTGPSDAGSNDAGSVDAGSVDAGSHDVGELQEEEVLTLGALTLVVASSIAGSGPASWTPAGNWKHHVIAMGDVKRLCDYFDGDCDTNQQPGGQPTVLSFSMFANGSAVGSYVVAGFEENAPPPNSRQVVVRFGRAGAGNPDYKANGGLFQVTAADATHIAGNYDLGFPEGRLEGTFDVPVCAGLSVELACN